MVRQLPRNWVDIRRDWGTLCLRTVRVVCSLRAHTIQYGVARHRGIIQAKVVILIALLAVVRRVIVVDLHEFTPASVAALPGLVLSLGGTYQLMQERDDRRRRVPGTPPPGRSRGDRELA